MSDSVVIIVDLETAGAPPAADSVRQLLALIETLPEEGGSLDWRLVSVSLNSPLRAEVKAFTPEGEEVGEVRQAAAAESAFAILDATNDNDPTPAVRRLHEAQRKRLRAILAPTKDRAGGFKVSVPGGLQRTITADRAAKTLAAIAQAPKRRNAEYGSIEGQILSATTHYGNPALRVRRFLGDEEVMCVFDKDLAQSIGAEHTLDEVWAGRRVMVTGRLTFDLAGNLQTIHAQGSDSLRILGSTTSMDAIRASMSARAAGYLAWDDKGA